MRRLPRRVELHRRRRPRAEARASANHTMPGCKVPAVHKFWYELALHKMALLASALVPWHCGRTKDIRCLTVGRDIRQHADPAGRRVITLDPCVTKTSHRQDQSERSEDPGKFLHPKVERMYREYLLKRRPVLMDNLGARAVHDVTYNDMEHGPISSKCTLLYFRASGLMVSARLFVRGTFLKAMGRSERKVRKAWSETIGVNECWDWGVNPDAAYQHFHHSREIHETVYRQGLRNSMNDMQAWYLGCE
ncbi:unnamed protein product [Polarella glacialis]|uniref:Uncharacterized protein n=1 Tax=Polarella glacialis TaxID=89957 RepID=A0A813EER9_POLGL|nr:unnamed protein product [Polarella glacialis]